MNGHQDGRIVAICLAVMIGFCLLCACLFPKAAQAEVGDLTAKWTLPNYGASKYVNGMAMTNDGHYAYVFKQNNSKHVTLTRIDTTTGKKAKMSLGKNVAKYCGHCNGASYAYVDGMPLLIVAPGKTPCAKNGQHYMVLLRISGTKATLYKRIKINFTGKFSCVAVRGVYGSKVSFFLGRNGELYESMFDVKATTHVDSATRVYGYSYNQDVSCDQNLGYVYGCNGGWNAKYGRVTKYEVTWDYALGAPTLERVHTTYVRGEPESSAVHGSKLYVAIDGTTAWNQARKKTFSDRIVSWKK